MIIVPIGCDRRRDVGIGMYTELWWAEPPEVRNGDVQFIGFKLIGPLESVIIPTLRPDVLLYAVGLIGTLAVPKTSFSGWWT